MPASAGAVASTTPCSTGSELGAAGGRGQRAVVVDKSGAPVAKHKPAATSTAKFPGRKRAVLDAAAVEAEPGLLTKKRRVGMRSSADRPPVKPTSRPAVQAAPKTLQLSVQAAPDNSVRQLYVDGGLLVAGGRLLRSKRVLHGRVVDADLVVVCLLSVRAGLHSYPYQTRFPPPSAQRSKLRMADVLRTSIFGSRALVRVVQLHLHVVTFV